MLTIFSSDLHGNAKQYKLLFKKAESIKAETIIIGGDVSPKGTYGSILDQKIFLKNEFMSLVTRYNSKKKYNILIILGNDDWASGADVLKEYDGKLLHLFHNKKVTFGGTNFVGYSFVPITPFGIKDWEKWDTKSQSAQNINLFGVKSNGDEMEEFSFNSFDRSDSIENDLKKMVKISKPKKTIYVFHSPPFNTKVDRIYPDIHIGSKAIRQFILKNQPPLSLHGHVHEAVDISGSFTDRLKKTICASVGNYYFKPELAVLIFDTKNIKDIRREIVK